MKSMRVNFREKEITINGTDELNFGPKTIKFGSEVCFKYLFESYMLLEYLRHIKLVMEMGNSQFRYA